MSLVLFSVLDNVVLPVCNIFCVLPLRDPQRLIGNSNTQTCIW